MIKEKLACEAREIQLMLPRKVLNMTKEEQKKLLQNLAEFLRRKYGMTCALGLHLSRTDQNVHIHILFSERLRLAEPEQRIAKRNTFLDEKGIRRRTKKEILDADGQVREGCRIVQKGEVIATRYFGEKEPLFADRDWCRTCKEELAEWINETLEPDKKRVLFNQTGPFLAQEHVGKGRPEKQKKKVEEYNRTVKAFNQMVRDQALEETEAQRIKSVVMLSPNRLGALGGMMAGLLLERPELQRYLRGTLLGDASKAGLEDIQRMGVGGKRTSTDPDKEKKERLRELYRQAERMRKQAREAESEFDKKRFTAEARRCSMQIDRLRRELGYYQDFDYARRLKQIDDEIKWMQRRVDARRAAVASVCRRIDFLEREIKKMQEELYELPVIFETKKTRSKKDSLRQRIKNNEQEIEKLKEEEKLYRFALRLQKAQMKLEWAVSSSGRVV